MPLNFDKIDPILEAKIRSDKVKKEGKKEKGKVYNIREDQYKAQLKKEYDKGMDDGIKESIVYSMVVSLNALRDEYGFGEKRLIRYIDRVEKIHDCLNETVSLEDLRKVLIDEVGIDVREIW